jgi:hypothetical protein
MDEIAALMPYRLFSTDERAKPRVDATHIPG